MSGGLVQDYSKSPIKPVSSPEIPSQPAVSKDHAYTPVPSQSNHNQPIQSINTSSSTTTKRASVNYGAPPRRSSIDARTPFASDSAPQVSQQTSSHSTDIQSSPYSPAYTQSQTPPISPYGQPPGAQAYQAGYNQQDQAGYRQNPMHDGGSTDYTNTDGQFNMEYAEKTWKAATETVSGYTSTAGEVAGNAIGSIKGWLNPESKGMR